MAQYLVGDVELLEAVCVGVQLLVVHFRLLQHLDEIPTVIGHRMAIIGATTRPLLGVDVMILQSRFYSAHSSC